MQNLTVKKSAIHGSGLFLLKPVKKGGFISYVKGDICKMDNKTEQDALANSCWIGVSKNIWIDPHLPYRFINHSCNPSAGIRGKVTLVALKNLEVDDEVTLDYSTIEGDPRWYMNCSCGESNCRKKIKSIEFLPKKIFDRYFPFIPTYFKKFYLRKLTLKS